MVDRRERNYGSKSLYQEQITLLSFVLTLIVFATLSKTTLYPVFDNRLAILGEHAILLCFNVKLATIT